MEATAEARTTLRENFKLLNEVNAAEPPRIVKKTSGGRYERTAKGAGKRGMWWEEREMCQHTPDSRTAGCIPIWSDNIVSDPGNPVASWRALASADMTGWGAKSGSCLFPDVRAP
ncbi:hypothetical protein B0H11DRAFT_2202280 [Mycena galericulata]|nr:hypothetical protein B0H11DRAFT_2202280 [Mycena galericulata]